MYGRGVFVLLAALVGVCVVGLGLGICVWLRQSVQSGLCFRIGQIESHIREVRPSWLLVEVIGIEPVGLDHVEKRRKPDRGDAWFVRVSAVVNVRLARIG